jgi:hypothetical protein
MGQGGTRRMQGGGPAQLGRALFFERGFATFLARRGAGALGAAQAWQVGAVLPQRGEQRQQRAQHHRADRAGAMRDDGHVLLALQLVHVKSPVMRTTGRPCVSGGNFRWDALAFANDNHYQ